MTDASECGNQTSGTIKLENSCLAEDLLASKEGLCFVESVT